MSTDSTTPDTIVLIHGFWVTPRSWEHSVERYEQAGYRVIAPADQSTRVAVLQDFYKPTPGLEPGTPSLRVSGRCHHQSPGVSSGRPSHRIRGTGSDSR
jgi:hypothetical protein